MSVMSYSEELVSAAPLAPLSPVAFEPPPAPFQRPGPEVLSESIPVVFIGRNRDGLWVARDADGGFGGLFWRRQAALDFAKANAAPGGCAIVFPQRSFELDMPGHGHRPLIWLAAVRRRLARHARRLMANGRKHVAL